MPRDPPTTMEDYAPTEQEKKRGVYYYCYGKKPAEEPPEEWKGVSQNECSAQPKSFWKEVLIFNDHLLFDSNQVCCPEA